MGKKEKMNGQTNNEKNKQTNHTPGIEQTNKQTNKQRFKQTNNKQRARTGTNT
jgi:hypothetical protein